MSIMHTDMHTIPSTRSESNQTPQKFQVGDGFIVTGKLVEIRNHTYYDVSQKKYHRYLALVLDVDEAAKRVFVDGKEVQSVLKKTPFVFDSDVLTFALLF